MTIQNRIYQSRINETGAPSHYPDGSPVPPGWRYDQPRDQSVPVDPKPVDPPPPPEEQEDKPNPFDKVPSRWKFPIVIPYQPKPGQGLLPPPFLPVDPEDDLYDPDHDYFKDPVYYGPYDNEDHTDPDSPTPRAPWHHYDVPDKWKDKYFPGWDLDEPYS